MMQIYIYKDFLKYCETNNSEILAKYKLANNITLGDLHPKCKTDGVSKMKQIIQNCSKIKENGE